MLHLEKIKFKDPLSGSKPREIILWGIGKKITCTLNDNPLVDEKEVSVWACRGDANLDDLLDAYEIAKHFILWLKKERSLHEYFKSLNDGR